MRHFRRLQKIRFNQTSLLFLNVAFHLMYTLDLTFDVFLIIYSLVTFFYAIFIILNV